MGSVGTGCGNDDDTGSYLVTGGGAAAARGGAAVAGGGAGPRNSCAEVAGLSGFACCGCTRHPAAARCWPAACGDVGEYLEGGTSAALGGVEIAGAGDSPGEGAPPAGNAGGGDGFKV
jgi:hypothetical protein